MKLKTPNRNTTALLAINRYRDHKIRTDSYHENCKWGPTKPGLEREREGGRELTELLQKCSDKRAFSYLQIEKKYSL